MPIRVLAGDVIDKIAAGEVLERPANLLKELIENSLDAGADELEIEFEQGGREVVVRDNGGGMSREDLRLALLRHATSKITSSDDIYSLHSFGFRGEALASIAAVSELTLTSRQGETAYRVVSQFGQIDEPTEIAARPGTEVRVRALFENVPARRRFLKSDGAEHGQIKTALKALGLANPSVGFRVRSKGDLLFYWPKGQTFAARAEAVLDGPKLHPGELNVDGITARVLVSAPTETQNVNRHMWFFVQGRWVQDRSLSAAVMEAYRNTLMHGEYPTAVVQLELAPHEVDVNVHPTKAQVKFREPSTAFRATCRAIRQVLEAAPWLGTRAASVTSGPAQPATQLDAWRAQAEAFVPREVPASERFQAPEFERVQYATKAFPLAEVREAVSAFSVGGSAPGSDVGAAAGVAEDAAYAGHARLSEPGRFRWADLQVIGQSHHTYIVAQDAEHFFLVDQHAAHERVMFEKLMHGFRAGQLDVQNLLLPLVFDLSAEEVEALHARRETIERLGLSVERMGPESLAVQAIPALVSESAVSEALQRLAYELVQSADGSAFERAVGEIFATMACHSVVRAGQALSGEQMRSLLVQMDDFPLSSFCPHGRPVYIKRRFSDIEREFGRIV